MQVVSIQYLRGVAALMVVVFHLKPQLERMGADLTPPSWLAGGVDLFFVISGFIMWWTTWRSDITPGRFMLKRIHRIVPLYWAITSFYVLVLLVAPRVMQTGGFDIHHVVASFLFIPWPHPVLDANHPLVAPGWTLNFEMFFYVVFAACLFLPRRFRLPGVIGLLAALVALGRIFQPEAAFLQAYTSTLLAEFLFGVAIAALVTRGVLLPPVVALAAILIGAVGLIGSEDLASRATRFFWWGVPAALIIYGCVSYERQRAVPVWGLPLLLGNASYSIYISHQLTLSAAGQAWRRASPLPDAISAYGFVLFGIAVAIVGGILCYFLVERPLGDATGRLMWGRRSPQARAGLATDTPASESR